MPNLEALIRALSQPTPPQPQGSLAQVLAQGLNQEMPPAIRDDPSWYRADGTRKGKGFLGELPHASGGTSTELSIGVDIGGKQMEIPSLVPTLSPEEIQHLLSGGEPHEGIVQKAVDHAKMRMQQGLPVFKE